jgi:hypothetical protein
MCMRKKQKMKLELKKVDEEVDCQCAREAEGEKDEEVQSAGTNDALRFLHSSHASSAYLPPLAIAVPFANIVPRQNSCHGAIVRTKYIFSL